MTERKSEETIFDAAIRFESLAKRDAYLAEACGDDDKLRADVEALLRSHDSASFLDAPVFDAGVTLDDSPVSEGPGTQIGRYKLLEKIGEGGMAVVYMAEQKEPIRRKVALKIIKLGMDTKQVIARFEAERQALAMMDHPNIAKVLDAGATETGRPYFVMELVKGVSITEYCDKSKLSTRERLELFVQVCNAVQHAHQKGIIHRDIKPTNVMVTLHDGTAVPKVIDFGIAKATCQRLTEKTVFTRYAQMIGTPAYMSPEQAEMSGLDVDTRTDIYSLGVLLYELLTGTTPFDAERLRSAGYLEIQRIIREEEPTRPSTKLSALSDTLPGIAEQRGTTPVLLRRMLRGDLDWIVIKALEKDRTRRYETVNALVMDIQRHLRNEPVLAGSPGAVYRIQKFWRRHRVRIVAAVVAVVLLLGSAVGVVAYLHSLKVKWARQEALPMITKLAGQDDYLAAFFLAGQVEKYIPEDPVLLELWPRISRPYIVRTDPAGADVYYKEYSDIEGEWLYLGRSPLESIRFPRGDYRWKLVKEGFETRECGIGGIRDIITVKLQPKNDYPEMVNVYSNLGGDYLIDKYEVTNEQYKKFVDGGGYDKREYWQHRFVKDGENLTWEEAMSEFVDKAGRPGPATWEGGTYPEGRDEFPVSGISWYEAAAYAEFVCKSLPSVSHWSEAARLGQAGSIIPYSNFGKDPAPVGSYPGVGLQGLYDMAGNVREWCWNSPDETDSKRYILGGSCGDPEYMFSMYSACSAFDRSPGNGVRCMDAGEPESLDDSLFEPIIGGQRPTRDASWLSRMSDEEFNWCKQLYSYERTSLDATVEPVDSELQDFRVEKATFNAAYNNERVTAYLFLPKASIKPYQVLILFPSLNARRESSSENLRDTGWVNCLAESGRAVILPIYKSTYERGGSQPVPRETPAALLNYRVQMYQDLARSIDYLESRGDMDVERLAFVGLSWGAAIGPGFVALEDRIRFVVLVNGGCYIGPGDYVLGTDSARFATRITVPVLMVNGRDDTYFDYETSQKPLFELLGTPSEHKFHKLYPGSHGAPGFPRSDAKRYVVEWLDKYLGPVEKVD